MLEILYYIFIFPLEQVLDYTLFVLHKLSGSYGLSIIALSLLVNALMLKITLLFERKGRAVQARKMACDSKIAEFKRVFKGAELQSYIRTLYKQRHFHPIHTLAGLGGLAVQIPFFIAILHLVEHSNFLQGVGFLWISDLSKPDFVAGIESLHLLPLIMTALTLINVFYSVQERGARIQGTLIALFFLVLLYNMPSALVLYWSCNMAFSLAKEVVKKWWGKREGVESRGLDSKRGQSLGKASESAWSNDKAQNLHSRHDSLGGIQNLRYVDSRGQGGIAVSKGCNALAQKGFISRVVYSIFPPHSALDSKSYATYRDISIFAILNICFMICVFTPYAVYSSDVSQFDTSQTYQTLGVLFGCFLLSSFGLIYLTSFFYKTRLLKLGAYGFSVLLLIGVVYTFVLDYNVVTGQSYSQLDNFMFKDPNAISGTPYNKYVDLCVGLLASTGGGVLMYASKLLRRLLFVIFIGFVGVSVASGISTYKQREYIVLQQASGVKTTGNIEKYLPSFQHDLGAFSKDSENVLVLLFDGFSGSHLQIIFDQFPEFKEAFQGFIYYPNTLSLDGNTTITAHTILSGFKTSAFNHREGNIEAFWNAAADGLKQTYKALRDSGFSVQSYGMPHIKPDKDLGDNIAVHATNWIFSSNMDYSLYYEKLYGLTPLLQELRAQNRPVGELVSLGLFYFAPYTLRARIYSVHFAENSEFADYAWIFATDKLKNARFLSGVNTTSQLASIVRNLNTEARGKTFKYIHTLHTHYPWVLDSTTCIPSIEAKTQLPDQYKPFLPNPHHYDNEICAIKETMILIDFLKKNHIYDNTMIVLVSDHSYNDLPAHNMPNQPSYANNPNPLLAIKDFDSNKPLATDSRLMSNADVYGILCDKFSICSDAKDIRKHYPKHREILHTLNVEWTDEVRKMPKLYFEKMWIVRDNVLNPKAFKDITQDFKNGTLKLDGVEH